MPKRKSQSTGNEGPADTTRTLLPLAIHLDDTAPPPLKRRNTRRSSTQHEKGSTNPDKNANVLDGPEALRASPDADETDERMDLEKAGMDVKKQVKEDDESELSELPALQEPPKMKNPASKSKAGKKGNKSATIEDEERGATPLQLKKAAGKRAPNAEEPEEEVVPVSSEQTQEAARKKPEAKAKSGETDSTTPARQRKMEAGNAKEPQFLDPEAEGDEEADEEEIKAALSRPPPVHSDYLPLPWKGRLGYACLCTYLRFSNPPVFSSRTCRIASILENRHPLTDPNAPPHATKNRPDREKPADVARGQEFVESLGKANAKDIVKMLRWNDRYGIKFMRLSSEMFPFASHAEYGYKLAPFVSEELAEAGRIAGELGHRLTTHPGQYTQLGSPRKTVIDNAFRDLDYHAELLDLLKLPPQQDRDAVMILHLGGVFGDKEATLNRFRENYAKCAENVKKRLVLENDDVSWCVHELLPLCEELNIPMVLDFHHHNIIFDAEQVREGTKDIVELYPRILATWKRKNITPKMHYSEPYPSAITGRQRRKHSPRVATLPPCPPDMDLMIEAKDKEQAVFELMRVFKLPGYNTFNDIIPHVRKDDNKPIRTPKKKTPRKKAKKVRDEDDELDEAVDALEAAEDPTQQVIEEDDVGMGGPEGRVYWPPSMEHWLRPVKKVIKPKEPKVEGEADKKLTPAQKKKAAADAAKDAAKLEEELQTSGIKIEDVGTTTPTPASKKVRPAPKSMVNGMNANGASKRHKKVKKDETPTISEEEEDEDEDPKMSNFEDDQLDEAPLPKKARVNGTRNVVAARRASGRAKKISYTEDGEEQDV